MLYFLFSEYGPPEQGEYATKPTTLKNALISNLADLEELSPTPGRCHCGQLFSQAIEVARRCYGNSHVYPYTYQGGYFYRNRMYKEALESWANAADAIRSYNYSREDEEIYKEFLEIANELIPFVMKVEGSGHSARSILKDSECFAHLLRFYDGICQWEEGSCTPVLHIGWAKPLVNTISKFDSQVRRHVVISCSEVAEEDTPATKPPAKEQDKEERLVDSHVDDKTADQKAWLGSTVLAALTDLCGRTVLSPAFFLGPDTKTGSYTQAIHSLNISGTTASTDSPVKIVNKPKLYLRSHKMAGLKDLLLSEKLNTHAISLQLTAQSQKLLVYEMNQADLSKLVSALRIAVKPKPRPLSCPEGPAGRLRKLRATVTALVKYERIELYYPRAEEAQGYAERLISDAIRNGDCHKHTMEMADYWLNEKQLVHKLFKVLVPRYQNYNSSFSRLVLGPNSYPGYFAGTAILELKGNPFPALQPETHNYHYWLHNVLLDEAKKEFRSAREERNAGTTESVTAES
uniref:Large ribosomal subunit protein bL17m n=2 Tax=Daphnia similis TaxID=35528 RepID=A0A4Y7N276_9CRUS|nr:EOG090X0EUO [Daphnia similis]SVE88305.1 EOG090X0EUO [Daphnia similis]